MIANTKMVGILPEKLLDNLNFFQLLGSEYRNLSIVALYWFKHLV